MITNEELSRFYEISRHMEKASRVSVGIPHDEVTMLVITELFRRYKNQTNSDDSKNNIKKVLTDFYLTEDEFNQLEEAE